MNLIKYQYEIARHCKIYRILHNYKISDVAKDTGYAASTISRFERGHNDNMLILAWYIMRGLDIAAVLGRIENENI